MDAQHDDLAAFRPMRLAVHREALAIQNGVPRIRVRRPGFGSDPEPDLRERLLRAAAAWLIGWAGLLALLRWGV